MLSSFGKCSFENEVKMFTFVIILILVAVVFGSGIYIVPDDKVHLISFLGNRPPKNGGVQNGIGSGFLTPGTHWFLGMKILHQPVYSMKATPFKVDLFRHDKGLKEAKAKIALLDSDIILSMSMLIQISDNSSGDVYTSQAAFWKAHYNSEQKDPLQQAEMIMNPEIKKIFLDKYYDIDPIFQQIMLDKNPNLDKDSLEFTGISNISPDRFLKELGLRTPYNGEGKFLVIDISAKNKDLGKKILYKLNESGMKIIDIFIDNIELREDVLQARAQKAKLIAEQNAKIASEYVRKNLIGLENSNLMESTYGKMQAINLEKEFEVRGKRIEIVGFIETIQQAALVSGGLISEHTLFEILFRYPALEKILGDKAKIIFQSGGDSGDITTKILSAIDITKDI